MPLHNQQKYEVARREKTRGGWGGSVCILRVNIDSKTIKRTPENRERRSSRHKKPFEERKIGDRSWGRDRVQKKHISSQHHTRTNNAPTRQGAPLGQNASSLWRVYKQHRAHGGKSGSPNFTATKSPQHPKTPLEEGECNPARQTTRSNDTASEAEVKKNKKRQTIKRGLTGSETQDQLTEYLGEAYRSQKRGAKWQKQQHPCTGVKGVHQELKERITSKIASNKLFQKIGGHRVKQKKTNNTRCHTPTPQGG